MRHKPGSPKSIKPPGQHTAEALRELGYSDQEIADLLARKVASQLPVDNIEG